jgi:hypothetical protein
MINLNLSLLSSWVFRYSLQYDSIWVKIVDHKYNTNNPNVLCSDNIVVSPFWRGVMWALECPSLVLVINDTKLLMPCVKCFELGISNTCDEGVCGKE